MKRILLIVLAIWASTMTIIAQNTNIIERSHITYTGQTLANICGYEQGGRAYALLGASKGMIITDVTDPDNPVQIVQIPGVDNLWKEIKVYQKYAYITSEGGTGLQIVDMGALPNPTLSYHNIAGDGAIAGQLNTIHALHIDTTKGFAYLFGSNVGVGGAVILDLNQDPYNPTYAGQINDQYIHDGFVDNDTLYAGRIYQGRVAVYDCTNKANPTLLALQQTPGNFTHNIWLSDDHEFAFTTDEVNNSFLTAYDIADLGNITEVDRIQSNPGSNSVVHNTHILHNWAITSWYKDGVTIVDVTRPHNLVQVGNYDTYTIGEGGGFEGAWGVYPYFSSGTMVVSNIDEGLYVLTPDYKRACYLEGTVTNANSGNALNGVSINIANDIPSTMTTSNVTGAYATGQVVEGEFQVIYSKAGFIPQTVTANFVAGEVVFQDIQLVPLFTASVNVTAAADNSGVANAQAILTNATNTFEATADANGMVSFDGIEAGTYTLYAGQWGYNHAVLENVTLANGANVAISLEKGYQDDFIFNHGWTASNTASSGLWTRAEPIGTLNTTQCNPELDVDNDLGVFCYTTGNGGGQASTDDVDNGSVKLVSPTMNLADYNDPIVGFQTWFYNAGGNGTPNDDLSIFITNGTDTVLLQKITTSTSVWNEAVSFHIKNLITLSNNMRLIVVTQDINPGNLVEGGFDAFSVKEGLPNVAGNITVRSIVDFPGQKLANVCGYTNNGKEYALACATNGTFFLDITNPDAPVQLVQISGISSLWREVKVYKHYAYVTTEGGGGLQIIDMTNIGTATPMLYHNVTPSDGTNSLGNIHALHIDTTKGFVYLFGSNLANGGAVILDLNQDPYNPTYAGQYNLEYIHDGYVDNDTLYAGQIYDGSLAIVDCTDKTNPVVLATQPTPGVFTHNAWLTDDRKTVLTTDENSGSFLTAYDVSDLNNVTETDRMQATPGSGSIVHNTHIRANWAVSSWYKDGVNIVDITRPHNIVQTGIYDTYTPEYTADPNHSGDGFDGAWGVYPFFPSGNMIVSNIPQAFGGVGEDGKLFILTPLYKRACYLEGNVTDASSGAVLNGVDVTALNINLFNTQSKADGNYATGTAESGTITVTFSKAGYISQTHTVVLENGEVTLLDVALVPFGNFTGTVVSDNPVANAQVILSSATETYMTTTGDNGSFNINPIQPGQYSVYASAWGYQPTQLVDITVSNNQSITIQLEPGYYDDFTTNLGWTNTATSPTGLWTWGEPNGTVNGADACNTDFDVDFDNADKCYLTGNAGGNAGDDDVDNGSVTLISPVMDLTNYVDPIVHYSLWFYNGGGQGGAPNDELIVRITNGTDTVILESILTSGSTWRPASKFKLVELIPVTTTMQLLVEANDVTPGHLVEAAFDAFWVEDVMISTENIEEITTLVAAPNPFLQAVTIRYQTQKTAALCVVYNQLGENMAQYSLSDTKEGAFNIGEGWSSGVYYVKIIATDGSASKVLKVVKQ